MSLCTANVDGGHKSLFDGSFAGWKADGDGWKTGGALQSNGRVFLRVWQDETEHADGRSLVQVTFHKLFESDPTNLGYAERVRHVDQISRGAKCYLVLCKAKDVNASPRVMASYNDRDLFEVGEIVQRTGDAWATYTARVGVMAVKRRTE